MGSGLNFFLNAIDKTPTTTGQWVDVDVSGDISSGSTGVILDIHNTGTTAQRVDVRKNGSTDDESSSYVSGTCHFYAIIGVDANRIVEAYIGSASVKIYLKGYTDSYVVLFTNQIDKSTSSTGSYVDTDVSSDVSEDATGVILRVKCSSSSAYAYAVRKNGSTDDRFKDIGGYKQYFIFIGIDASKIFEQKIENAVVDIFLLGYFKPPVAFFTNAIDKSLSPTATWTDIDLTSDTEPTADGSIWEIVNINTTKRYGEFRKNGSSDNHSANAKLEVDSHVWGLAGLDSDNICEGIIQTTAVDFYLIGYCKPPVTTYAKTYNADTLLKKPDITKNYVSDVLLQKQGITKTYGADLLLKKPDIVKTYSSDVLLKKFDITKSYASDVLLKKPGITKTYTVNVLLVLAQTKTYSADLLLMKSLSKTYQTDVLLKKSDITKTYPVDVLLLKSIPKTYFTDLLLKKLDITKTYTADTILYKPWYGIIHSELSMLERGMSFKMTKIKQKIELVQRTMKIALHEIKQKLESLERKMKIEVVAE